MRNHIVWRLLPYCTSTILDAAIVLVYLRWLHVNEATVALTFLVVILLVAAKWGLRHAVYLSLLSAAALNFFFLPPVLTFTIGDSHNWVALLAFLITGFVASHLAEKARAEAERSQSRERETKRLYEFTQQMLITGNVIDLLNRLPQMITSVFGLTEVAVYVRNNDHVYRSHPDYTLTAVELRDESFSVTPVQDSSRGVTLVPILMGTRPMGAIGAIGKQTSIEALEAIGGLAAIAIERANAIEKLTQLQAARESERLRSALLDSVAHELRTPLTSIIGSITSLRSMSSLGAEARSELMGIIEEEAVRLNELIGQAMEMAELDAHEVKLDLHEHSIQEAVEASIEAMQPQLRNHPVDVRLPKTLPPVNMDLKRIEKVLCHLLENAAKYSEEGSPILISGEVAGDKFVTSVADRGVGIDDHERATIFDAFYRGQNLRSRIQGTGMGLAIAKAIVEAHNGTIDVTSQPGIGSVFTFNLPLA